MNTTGAPQVKLDAQGLVTAIAQDADSGEVLMIASMSPESVQRTLDTGDMVFYSRSRQELWHKGDTSGSFLHVQSAQVDCDGDVLLFQVKADGPVCHTGAETCFFTPLEITPAYDRVEGGAGVLDELFHTIKHRQVVAFGTALYVAHNPTTLREVIRSRARRVRTVPQPS